MIQAKAVFRWAIALAPACHAQARIFGREEVDFFHREGYIKVAGLLDQGLLDDLSSAAEQTIRTSPKFNFYFSVSQTGIMFGRTTSQEGPTKRDNSTKAFRDAALYSKLPQAAAELMRLDPTRHNLRVLRDVFLAKSVQDTIESCDWHVDDLGFWPESYLSEQGMDGVNVWIALEDMPAPYQGSMAVAPGSHTAKWRDRAYHAIGQNRSEDGGKTKEEVIRKRQLREEESKSENEKAGGKPKSKYPTCDMRLADPEMREKIDSSKHVFDVKRGDVIFATRLLFHSTLPVTDAGMEYYQNHGVDHLSRYSIRYVPGSARLPSGWSVEWSIVDDGMNAGRSLDAVVGEKDINNKLFYPQVWPTFEPFLQQGLQDMAAALPDLAQSAQAEFMATIFGSAPNTKA